MRSALTGSLCTTILVLTIVSGGPVAQSREQPSPDTAALLVRRYLQHRLEMTRQAPILRFCLPANQMLSKVDSNQLVADGLIASIDSLCVDDGPPPSVARDVTTIDIYGAMTDSSEAELLAAQIYGERWYIPETVRFRRQSGWTLLDISIGQPVIARGSVIPYTTRSNRPASRPGFPPDSGKRQ
jgi:hypothetical protein